MQHIGVHNKFLSHAKINLGLRVLGKRSDGYHDIETFFQQIDLHDILEIEPTTDGHILIAATDPHCPLDERNLAYRAADLLRKNIGDAALGCRIHIQKRIPMGAGLGGGSSNAATTLVALNELWMSFYNQDDLLDYSSALGADVPFFIRGGLALGEKKGEILTPMPLHLAYNGVLIYPNLSISTAWVYNNLNLNLTKNKKFAKFGSFRPKFDQTALWKTELENDLTSVVLAKYPELSRILEKCYECGAFYAQMSGSGSTFFGLFEHREAALHVARFFRSYYRTAMFKPIY
ncbi:4-(cytidine 5'-diphospho)-2-C-methyl-D-erythritol kinase [candidate division KSB1 bacterium]|nr:4-(cytidine 5'-diphospho)-2-C-methyl-D-erythritol kinase [candidate division KSB1 bacterium]RQV99910.1 MAG: 4-(cytidine 5'-diphospho)-2-C-methyl-D-erythritol kinase [candidate division KSB1 bacterium]